uniref:Uncharacterized protein n=1 Tax=Rhizophora mucronata TaxID=61149 RepID=A0A2P2QUC5_RHIMU
MHKTIWESLIRKELGLHLTTTLAHNRKKWQKIIHTAKTK